MEHYSVFLHLWFLPSQQSCSGGEQEPPQCSRSSKGILLFQMQGWNQPNIPLQRELMLPSSPTHPSPFAAHACSAAMSFLFKQFVSVGRWGKNFLLLWGQESAPMSISSSFPAIAAAPLQHRWVPQQVMGQSRALGGSPCSEIQLLPGAAGTGRAFLDGRALLLSHPQCCCPLAPSPKTSETIQTLLGVIFRDGIGPAGSSGAEQKGHKNWSTPKAWITFHSSIS